VSVSDGISCKIMKCYTYIADCTLVLWMLDSVVGGLPAAPYILGVSHLS